ncbi:hypothetical protein GGP66_000128 [Salinibacter ruber]|uniref:Uncharacterized protein n=1 Tax=Salinibacter ruber TaxID=146919 RepID=A0A9X2Z916_9BACT|nr:hypothetical protein [Salinibacter ruber]MCS3672724.1 hypothetical protein [Salinibacter ruber]MCS3783036.1 hypothetical protein [Salinibacter ruber]MCS4035215.1 hypothetical protein [Salinibacter ruber]
MVDVEKSTPFLFTRDNGAPTRFLYVQKQIVSDDPRVHCKGAVKCFASVPDRRVIP